MMNGRLSTINLAREREWWWRSGMEGELREEPWLHPEVTRYLEGLLRRDMRVLEHGSGGSTLWLAGRVREVRSVESSLRWAERVWKKVPRNVKVLLWNGRELPWLGKEPYDLMLIDGEPVEDRRLYLKAAQRLLKPGGVVVLDNANRAEYAGEVRMMDMQAERLRTFDENTRNTKHLVTRFWRLKADSSGLADGRGKEGGVR